MKRKHKGNRDVFKSPKKFHTIRAAINDRTVRGAMNYNHLAVLAVMFVMTTKPSLAGSIAALAVALVLAVVSAMSAKTAAAPSPSTE